MFSNVGRNNRLIINVASCLVKHNSVIRNKEKTALINQSSVKIIVTYK